MSSAATFLKIKKEIETLFVEMRQNLLWLTVGKIILHNIQTQKLEFYVIYFHNESLDKI